MMVRSTTSYICEKCSKRFRSHHEAEDCEIGHIAQDVIAEFKSDLAAIVNIDAIERGQQGSKGDE
jgi:hypothetical protein